MAPKKVIDWLSLGVEFITSTIAPYELGKHQFKDKSEFFRVKQIPFGTWTKKADVRTWDLRRNNHLLKTTERAIAKDQTEKANKLAKYLAQKDQLGDLLIQVGVEGLTKKVDGKTVVRKEIAPKKAVECGQLIEKGLSAKDNVLNFGNEDTLPNPTFNPTLNQAIQINVPGAPTINESDAIDEIEGQLSRLVTQRTTA